MTSHSLFPHLKQKFSEPHCAAVVGKCVLTLQGCYAGAKAKSDLEIRGSENNISDNVMQVRVFRIEKHH